MGRWVVVVDRAVGTQNDVDEVAHFEGTQDEAGPVCTSSPAPTVRAPACARSADRSTGSVTGTPTT